MTPKIRCIRAVVSTKTLLLHLVRTTTTTTTTRCLGSRGDNSSVSPQDLCLFVTLAVTMADGDRAVTSAAKRRRERRLRAAWKHEQLSVAMALAAATHHSAPRSECRVPNDAIRGRRPPVQLGSGRRLLPRWPSRREGQSRSVTWPQGVVDGWG